MQTSLKVVGVPEGLLN